MVFTILKNISQWEGLFPIYGKIKKCSKPPISLIWFNWENDPKKWDNRPRSSQGGNEWE